MNVRQSVLGEVAILSGRQVTGVDVGALVRRLLLFDRVVIKSIRLKEVPLLVRAFGKTGFAQLLESRLLSFSSEFTTLAIDVTRGPVRDLPLSQFSFGIVDAANRDSDLRSEFVALQGISGLKNSDRAFLEEIVWTSIVRPPKTYGQDLLNQFDHDVRSNSPALQRAISSRLNSELESKRSCY